MKEKQNRSCSKKINIMKQIYFKRNSTSVTSFTVKAAIAPVFFLLLFSYNGFSQVSKDSFLLNYTHFHLTNYIQEGTDIHKFLEIMGNKVGVLLCLEFHCNKC